VRPAEVAVTGMGAVTAAGLGMETLWDALVRGVSLAAADENLAGLPVDFSCHFPDFDADALLGTRLGRRLDRFSQMALVAAREAVVDAGLSPTDWDPTRVAVILGVASNSLEHYESAVGHIRDGRPERVSPLMVTRSIPNMAAGEVATGLHATGPNFTTSSACASSATAIGVARDLLRAGACDIAITGGAEFGPTRLTTTGFWRMNALSECAKEPQLASRPFDADRDGFVLGEGAGILVLERADHARARGAPIRALLAGYGASSDAYHFACPHPEGDGAVQALNSALQDAGLEPDDIGYVNAHGTSTRLNDLAESKALHRVFGDPPPVTSNKGVIGHTLGAAGALEAIATVLSLQNQLIPPTANLTRLDPDINLDIVAGSPRPAAITAAVSNSFGFGGQNAVLVLRTA
jgi:3-oxoacyl-[acyl-carrier-protein] synthase II